MLKANCIELVKENPANDSRVITNINKDSPMLIKVIFCDNDFEVTETLTFESFFKASQ